MLSEVADDIRTLFSAPDRATTEAWLAQTVQKYEPKAARLADWMEINLPEGLTVFSFRRSYQWYIRTANLLERLNRKIKHHSQVVGIFPNEAACLQLSSAFLMEKSEAWLTLCPLSIGRMYLSFEGSEQGMLLSSPS